MKNPIEQYIKKMKIGISDLARMLSVTPSCVFHWKNGIAYPCKKNAWKLHRLSGGKIPLSCWGYAIINGKIVKIKDESKDELG